MDTVALVKVVINTGYIKIAEENDIVIFKNTSNDKLVKISSTEYLLLEKYVENQSLPEVINFAKTLEVEMSIEQLIQLIETAKELKLIITSDEAKSIEKKQSKENASASFYTMLVFRISSLLSFLFRLTKLDKIGVRPEFTGDFKFFKLFSIDVSNTFLSKNIVKPVALLAIVPVLLVIAFGIFNLTNIQQFDIFTTHSFGGVSLSQITLSKSLIFFIVITGAIITSFFHEFAHYFVYKQLQGKTNEFGFALMNYFLPVVYVSTNSVYLWDKKWKKIFVTSAGILFDVILVFGLYVLIATHALKDYPNITFIAFLTLLYLAFRTLINANFLIPGTDGYFIFVDIFNFKNFFQTTFNSTKLVFRSLFRGRLKQIRVKNVIHTTYYLLSLIFIIVSSLLILIILFYPFISDLLLELMI